MALDEALLRSTEARPTLRFYTWNPGALSLGYFQRFDRVAERERAPVVVRRLTGGGAIHHRDELTFSIAAPADHPLYRGEVRASYERVHDVLAHAFRRLGVRAERRGARPLGSDRPGSAMCFHVSTPLDLVWDGAKGVGSAQRRTGGRVLHHGSIKLDTTPLEGPIARLRRHVPDLAPADLAEHVLESFRELLGARFTPEEPDPAELLHARRQAARFRSPELLGRR